MLTLDHILWAAPDLDDGMRRIEALTGVKPARGGSHPGLGTRNGLMALGDGLYFEILAPDPAQNLDDNLGGRIAALPRPGLIAFALAGDDLAAARAAAGRAGLSADEPVAMSRTRPDGVRLDWSVMYFRHPSFGEPAPFVIDWGSSPHPSRSTPKGCTLMSFAALHPEPEPLAEAYRALGIPLEVERAAEPGFMARLNSPKGTIVLLGA